MKPKTTVVAATLLLGLALPALVASQEIPRRYYSDPIGLTELDALRVILAPAPPRLAVPNNIFCQVEVTVEVLDALNLKLLESFGTQTIGPGTSFVGDFQAFVGAPPARQEVIVRTTIERKPKRAAERGSLGDICPLLGSAQLLDPSTGRTTTIMPTDKPEKISLNDASYDDVG